MTESVHQTTKQNMQKRILLIFFLFLALLVLQMLKTGPVYAASCTPPATTYGTDTMSATITSTTTYTIWVHMKSATSGSNSILLNIAGSKCYQVGGSASMPLNSWQWINYQNGSSSQTMQASLSAGANSLVLTGTSPGISVDRILILGDNTCTPTGDGSNCTSSSSPTGTTSSSSPGQGTSVGVTGSVNQPIVSPTLVKTAQGTVLSLNNGTVSLDSPVIVSPTYIKGQTISKVYYYLNGKLVDTADTYPYTYHLDTSNLETGKYLLSSKTVYESGLSKTASETIVIKHSLVSNTGIVLANNVAGIISIVFIYIIFVAALLAPKSTYPRILEALHLKSRPSLATSPTSVGVYRAHRIPTTQAGDEFNDEVIITPTENLSQIDSSMTNPNEEDDKII